MPPAGTVVCVQAPVVAFLTQQPVWIVPGVSGAMWPWRSLMASSWTLTSFFLWP